MYYHQERIIHNVQNQHQQNVLNHRSFYLIEQLLLHFVFENKENKLQEHVMDSPRELFMKVNVIFV